MPKVSSYTQRDDKIRAWIAAGVKLYGLRTQKELARRIGMPQSTFDQRLACPENFRLGEIWRIERIIGKMEV